VELQIRLGDVEVVVGLESLAIFGTAADVAKSAVPAGLRAAFLNGLAVEVWQELEALTRRAITVLDVRLDPPAEPGLECLGFEVGRDPEGPVARGFLRLVASDSGSHADLRQVLWDLSEREMPTSALPTKLALRWAAVAGSTTLTAGELRGLEEHDIVLIDDARAAPNALNCWLGAGPTRRRAGHLLLGRGGKLQMVQWGSSGDTHMGVDADAVLPKQAEFADVPVKLRFELAQWNATLAEVSGLAPGALLDLGHAVDEHAVSVWVEERCVGKGRLVAIGERLGVRLISVFGNPAADGP
jgi:type III secretion protein Q